MEETNPGTPAPETPGKSSPPERLEGNTIPLPQPLACWVGPDYGIIYVLRGNGAEALFFARDAAKVVPAIGARWVPIGQVCGEPECMPTRRELQAQKGGGE